MSRQLIQLPRQTETTCDSTSSALEVPAASFGGGMRHRWARLDAGCIRGWMECFRVNGRLHCRELGYCNWMGDSGRVAFLPKQPFHCLTRDDKRHIQFVTRHIHGLSYYPDKGEDVTSSVDDVVQQLYQACKSTLRTPN